MRTASQWYSDLPRPSLLGSSAGLPGTKLRKFDNTSESMSQPALTENIVAIHLGGAKRVRRAWEVTSKAYDVAVNSLTFMPAYQANHWTTEGPISFAHLTLSAGLLARLADESFRATSRSFSLSDQVGIADPLASNLMLTLLNEFGSSVPNRLYRDTLLTTLVMTVLRQHSTLRFCEPRKVSRGGLAGWQLKRVVDYMTEHVSSDIGLPVLVELTGLSRAQFFRAFRQSTGQSPADFLCSMRMRLAQKLLSESDMTVKEVAHRVGYGRDGHFATVFKRATGSTPVACRRLLRANGIRDQS